MPRRFCGPPDSGNGGWTAGELATFDTADRPEDRAESWSTIEVTLRQPPPLETPLHVATTESGAEATFGGAVIASARGVDTALTDVDPVDPAQARAAEASYAG